MSRSIKKNPIVRDSNRNRRKIKRYASKKTRHILKDPDFEISDGRVYKKLYPSRNIADCKFYLFSAHGGRWDLLNRKQVRKYFKK